MTAQVYKGMVRFHARITYLKVPGARSHLAAQREAINQKRDFGHGLNKKLRLTGAARDQSTVSSDYNFSGDGVYMHAA